MKDISKKLSILLTLTIVISSILLCLDVQATPLIDGPTSSTPWFPWTIESLKGVGLIFDPEKVYDPPSIQDLKDAIEENDPNANISATDESINEYINNNITTDNSDNSVVYNDNSKFVVNYVGDYLKERYGYKYLYGCSLQKSQEYFGSNIFQIAQMLNNNHNSFVQIGTLGESVKVHVYNYNFGSSMIYGVLSQDYSADWKRIKLYEVKNINGVMHVDLWFPEDSSVCSVYDAVDASSMIDVSSNYNYPLSLGPTATYLDAYGCVLPQQNAGSNQWNGYPKIFSFGNNGIIWFNSLEDLNTYIQNIGVGKYPYYTNNQVYSNWINSTGDFTLDSNNSNNIDYSQVNNYITDSYNENGEYPSLPDINNYITNTNNNNNENNNPNNPDNPSGGNGGSATANANNEGINININNNHSLIIGGSSLSGNSVSGNGNSSSGGFFDWISDIGDVIGNFIKNVGQLIADVVRGISETITTVMENIPNLLSTIVEFVYGGLPDELKALVTLGITSVVLVSVIKILRR